MTLDTRIFIYDRIDHMETFEKVCELLDIPDTKVFKDGQGEPYGCVPGREISNAPMQGFNAWVMTYSNPEGIRYSEEHLQDQARFNARMKEEYPDEPEEEIEYEPKAGVHFLQISMDTAYGFRDEATGEGCAMLHARVIANLGKWLDERGVRWAWENEFTGEIHQSYDGLREFVRGGDEANEWFTKQVLPLIESRKI